ncbi:MAG: hypothetical protein MZV65_01685 [Chromatiales bacterium]|nr:hypothetical protein [Chromatiales bacterium]
MTFPRMTKYLNAATCGVLLLADAALPAWALSSTRQEEVFQGVARDERGEIAYTEEHRMIYENGRPQRNETRYRDAKGKEIAVLTSNFTTNPYVPNYTFEDRRVRAAGRDLRGRDLGQGLRPRRSERTDPARHGAAGGRHGNRPGPAHLLCAIIWTNWPRATPSSRCGFWYRWRVATIIFRIRRLDTARRTRHGGLQHRGG